MMFYSENTGSLHGRVPDLIVTSKLSKIKRHNLVSLFTNNTEWAFVSCYEANSLNSFLFVCQCQKEIVSMRFFFPATAMTTLHEWVISAAHNCFKATIICEFCSYKNEFICLIICYALSWQKGCLPAVQNDCVTMQALRSGSEIARAE